MKRTLVAAAGFALVAACGPAGAAPWTVIVQPGVYGRVAIGGYAEPPQVYASQPVMAVDNGYGQVTEEVVDPAYATDQPPVYLWVPEYQRTHWAQYSRDYGANGVPVYFVDDGWYRANVTRRNWTPEQRSWTPQQWAEQDRVARDRLERQRFEQQRAEQQQRWNAQRAWYVQQQRQAGNSPGQQASWERDRAEQDAQNRLRAGATQGFVPPALVNGPRQGGDLLGRGVNAGPQPSAASQAHAAVNAGEGHVERDDRRGEREHERGRGAPRGGFEHGRGGRDR